MGLTVRKQSLTALTAIEGQAEPHAQITVRNLSAAPYAPPKATDGLERTTKADASGRFSLAVPAARHGDVVRVSSGKSVINLRIGELSRDDRRVETTTQGLRLFAENGAIVVENVRKHLAVGEPGARLRLVNLRDKSKQDITLDDQGRWPYGVKLRGKLGDTFSVRVTDGKNDASLRKQWALLSARSRDAAEPAVDPEAGPTTLMQLKLGSMKNISAADPKQGALGDCWIVASLASIAHTQPDVVRRLIQKDGAEYYVSFKRFDGDAYVEERIAVKPSFYVGDAGLLYGQGAWFALIEKAYAKWVGGYGPAACGYMHELFEAIYGEAADHLAFDALGADETWTRIAAAGERPLVACSFPDQTQGLDFQDARLVPDHAYSVLEAYEKDGERFVQLRNPWGSFEPAGHGRDDGVFTLPYTEFLKFFTWAVLGPE